MSRRGLLTSAVVIGGGTLLQACSGTLSPGQALSTPTSPADQTTQPAVTGAAQQPAPTPPPNQQAAPATSTSIASQTVVYGTSGEPSSINPLLDDSSNSRNVWELIFEGLVRPDPNKGSPTPWLAETWTSSPDGLTWQFKIRPNVKWSDGQPLTADDVQFTFQTALDPKTKTPFRSRFDNIASFDAPDPGTFQVALKAQDCPFLVTTMLVGILPRHLLQNSADINADEFNSSRPVGTGPFTFKEWRRGEFVTLVANSNHWRGRPKIEQWIRRVATNDQVLAQLVKTGEVDYAPVNPAAVEDLRSQPNLTYFSVSPATSIIYIGYNLDRPMFQDKRVRQALSHCVDRQGILDSVLFGEGDLVDSAIPYTSWARTDNVPKFTYDLEAARKLLGEAGWTPGADGILEKNGAKFAFTLTIQTGDQRRTGVATIAQDGWKKLGIQVQVEQMEMNAFTAKYLTAHDFDAVVAGGLGFTIDPDQTRFWATKEFPNGANFTHYSNPELDRLLDQARTSPGCAPDARKALYEQVQQILAVDQPWTFLYSARQGVVVNKRVQNATPSPWIGAGPYMTWGITDWTIAN
jgi:peptide/nickel transport system substrate-binding protein